MNLFKKYGIKEVADITFYSIIEIGDEEFYIPVLFLDTLKVGEINEKANIVNQSGGYGNSKIISWNFGKDITLKLQDALCSAASLSLSYGWLTSKMGIYSNIIAKATVANKYKKLNYSIYAYESPKFTQQEWEEIFYVISKNQEEMSQYCDGWSVNIDTPITKDFIEYPYVSEFRTRIQKQYKNRSCEYPFSLALIERIKEEISTVVDYSVIEHDSYEIEVIDRMEKCTVLNEEGFSFDSTEQVKNIQKFYENNQDENFVIYYDSKTMQPIANNGKLIKNKIYTLKKNTVYYKWSRTVQRKISDNSFLGKTLVIDSQTFSQNLKIVGETYIREQKTNKDSRFQFIINKAQIAPSVNINLSAAGEPSVFSLDVNVLTPENSVMMELRQFDVEEDKKCGGTKIKPQITQYTPTDVENIIGTGKSDDKLVIEEIY